MFFLYQSERNQDRNETASRSRPAVCVGGRCPPSYKTGAAVLTAVLTAVLPDAGGTCGRRLGQCRSQTATSGVTAVSRLLAQAGAGATRRVCWALMFWGALQGHVRAVSLYIELDFIWAVESTSNTLHPPISMCSSQIDNRAVQYYLCLQHIIIIWKINLSICIFVWWEWYF